MKIVKRQSQVELIRRTVLQYNCNVSVPCQLSERELCELEKEFIILDEVSITAFDFSDSFNTAIEAKVTAEQEALQAKNVLEKKRFEAEQRVVTAKGEAEAIRIQVESISKQGGESYVQMKAIEKWDGKLPAQMIPNATVPFIELRKAEQK